MARINSITHRCPETGRVLPTHGMDGTPECTLWRNIRYRCESPSCREYPDYGGRGIYVCDRWQSFDNFYADMGPRPDGCHPSGKPEYTLGRIDNDGPYSPENCRWETYQQQGNNRRSSRKLTYAGETMTLAQWSQRVGIDKRTLHQRLKNGWSDVKVIETPLDKRYSFKRKDL